MDENERYDKGMARRRKVLGNAWVDKANAGKTPFNSEFQEFITRYAWGEVWTRPHYDERTRRVLVIGTMLALDKWAEFRMHVRAALVEGGFTPDDIKEIIIQQAIYCGVPAANHAFKEAGEIIAELGKLIPTQSDRTQRRRITQPACIAGNAHHFMPASLRKLVPAQGRAASARTAGAT